MFAMSIAHQIADSPTLEQELAAILDAGRVRGRQARAVAARLGWDGTGSHTLAEAGSGEGYSRERVRQLEDRVRDHVRAARPRLVAVESALRLLADAAPIRSCDVAAYLLAAGYARGRFELTGLLTAAKLTGIEPGVRELEGLVIRPGQAQLVRETALHARRLVNRNGAARIEELTLRLGGRAPLGAARRILEAVEDVIWLDDSRSWFIIRGAPSRATRTLQKMLSVSPRLTVGELDDGLRRSRQLVVLPSDVVRLLCARQSWLTFDASTDRVTTNVHLDQGWTLTPIERGMVAIFHRAGPTLTFTDMLELGARDGLNPKSVGPYLTHSPVIRRLARGRYALCGWSG
jgi:hypothetical protein